MTPKRHWLGLKTNCWPCRPWCTAWITTIGSFILNVFPGPWQSCSATSIPPSTVPCCMSCTMYHVYRHDLITIACTARFVWLALVVKTCFFCSYRPSSCLRVMRHRPCNNIRFYRWPKFNLELMSQAMPSQLLPQVCCLTFYSVKAGLHCCLPICRCQRAKCRITCTTWNK